jgi:hypothetical protein
VFSFSQYPAVRLPGIWHRCRKEQQRGLPALVGVVDLLGCMGVEVLVAAASAALYQSRSAAPSVKKIKRAQRTNTSGVWCRAVI